MLHLPLTPYGDPLLPSFYSLTWQEPHQISTYTHSSPLLSVGAPLLLFFFFIGIFLLLFSASAHPSPDRRRNIYSPKKSPYPVLSLSPLSPAVHTRTTGRNRRPNISTHNRPKQGTRANTTHATRAPSNRTHQKPIQT
jgi:hypothetical protein